MLPREITLLYSTATCDMAPLVHQSSERIRTDVTFNMPGQEKPNASSVLSSMHVVCAVKAQLVYAMVITQIIKTLSRPGDCHSTS